MPTAALRTNALYWLLTWFTVVVHLGQAFAHPQTLSLWLYQGVLLATYAILFIAPGWLITRLLSRWTGITFVLQVALGSLLHILIFADNMMWELYGFHINGFVLNIVTTPGGIDALGSSQSSFISFTVIILAIIIGQLALRLLAGFLANRLPHWKLPRWQWVLPLFFVLTLGERVVYGVSHFYGYSPTLEMAQRMPLYQPLTMRRMLENQFGLERPQQLEVKDVSLKGQINYPKAELKVSPPEKPLNIVWMVGESWRADTLNARVMPQTYAFAQSAQNFTHHFSTGNGTRIGMFGQFYSLPANLWFPVLDARVGSPVIDVLQRQDYQIRLFTSAKFTYPEFDKTLFVNVPPEQMQSVYSGPTWQRDRTNIGDMLEFIDQRDPSRPFMTFMFFESPHANYDFPPDSVIEPDYLEDFNYANMDLERDIEGIHKRYINAVHHLDSQIARVIEHLKAKDLMDDTLIIITGDHGEEFMDHGRWGHNSTFADAQLRVPMVIHVPGRAAHAETARTSHLDVLPTVLPLLGVQNEASDYGIGRSLFQPNDKRDLAAGDWDRLAFLGPDFKVVMPFTSGSFTGMQVTTSDDQDVAKKESVLSRKLPVIQRQLSEYRQFLAH